MISAQPATIREVIKGNVWRRSRCVCLRAFLGSICQRVSVVVSPYLHVEGLPNDVSLHCLALEIRPDCVGGLHCEACRLRTDKPDSVLMWRGPGGFEVERRCSMFAFCVTLSQV